MIAHTIAVNITIYAVWAAACPNVKIPISAGEKVAQIIIGIKAAK